MNPILLQSLLDLAQLPDTDRDKWLESAEDSVHFLTRSIEADDNIILYASGPHLYVHSFLVPRASVDPPDHEALAQAHISITDSWCIQQSFGGGEGHRIYLGHPFDSPGRQALSGGEKLIFLRSFDGVKAYKPTIEINQKLVHSLSLYYMDERQAYCRLDQHGDIEDVISSFENDLSDPSKRIRVVTIKRNDLETFMALSDSALVIKFDFTRFIPELFSGWHEQENQAIKTENSYFMCGVITNHASYAYGHMLLKTALTERDLVEKWKDEENRSSKQYVSFKIIDGKNKRLVETSCAPDCIVNYFQDSDLPWEISPAFFRSEVLQRYKMDPEKYTLGTRSITCRGAWHLQTYDVNDAGQVHTYIGYLARLPYEEQLYWRAFNEWPKGSISKRAYRTDILGEFSTEDDPLSELKALIVDLDRDSPSWWRRRGEMLQEEALYPVTDSIEEWGNEILALDHLIVEGLHVRGLREIIRTRGGTYENKWGSLKLLETVLLEIGETQERAKELTSPLKELHNLRNPARAHGDPGGRLAVVASARRAHGTLRKHFEDLANRIRNSMKEIVSLLYKA